MNALLTQTHAKKMKDASTGREDMFVNVKRAIG